MDIKMRINQVLTSTKDLGIFDINDEDKVRIVVENAGSGNTIVVSGRITGQSSFVPLKTISGSSNEVVNVSTYEEIKIECTVFSALSSAGVKLLAASFKEAGGSAIESIGVPSGTDLTDIELLTFTSDDGSVTITGDNADKSIDFSVAIPNVPVTSVNSQTGDVLLDKYDIGLDNVNNTSDANKPISIATQNALDGLDGRIDSLEDTSEVLKFHVYENNAGIYADGRPGIRDTSTLIRDGWYFQNATGQKINWYFFDGNPLSPTYQGAITQANFNAYAVMTLDNKDSKPIIALYSLPTGSGDAIPGFAHSRWVYELSTAALSPLLTGTKYLFYVGANPPVHPELQHVALDLVPVQSIGDKNPSELILTAALNSNSGEPAGEVRWMVESLGVFSPTRKQEMELRIRTVPLNSDSKIDAIYLPSYVDDVVEYVNLAAFPTTGETGKIYVALDTNKIYRWSGSTYIEISPGAIPPVLSVNTKTGHVVLDKTDIGLGNVDNTSDLNKPISTATQTALNLKYDASNPAGYITAAEVPESPVLSVNQQTGNVFLDKYDIGLENVDNTSDANKPISDATQDALDLKYDASNPAGYITAAEVPASPVLSVNTKTGDVVLDKTDIGLGNVDNTSDADKPISDDTQDALDGKADTNLDNLVATAIPAGVNLESLNADPTTSAEAFRVRTKNATATTTGMIVLESGQSTNPESLFTATGVVNINSGSVIGIDATTSEGNSGSVNITSGGLRRATGNSGELSLRTGFVNESVGNSGKITIETGSLYDGSVGDSGDIEIKTGDTFGATGSIKITTEDPNSFSSSTGDITISTRVLTPLSTDGTIFLRAKEIDAGSTKIVNLADGQSNTDAVNVSQLNAILDYTPADTLDWQSPVPDDIKEALDQLADRLQSGSGVSLDAFEDMKEPTGFLNRTDSTLGLSYDSGTNTVTFTITPVITNFQFYVKGTKYTKSSAESIQIASPTAGIHYLYYNSAGVLSYTTTFSTSLFEDNALVSLFYWNTDTNSYIYFAEERHGLTMDGATQAYLHTVLGARYLSGLALQGFTLGDGSLDSHAQFTSDSGSIRDEDILHVINAQTQIPILFKQGNLWRKKTADNFPVIYSESAGYTGANGRLPYNQYNGTTWQLTEVDSNKFVLVHLFATNDIENKVVGIQGIAQYNDVPAARNAASEEITSLSDLPFAEFVPIGTVIYQTNTYTNAIDARIRAVDGADYVDFRGTQLYTPAGEATTHSLLSGLAGDDHIQYHTDERGDARYNLKSSGDISETSFSITQNQLTQTVLGFSFNNAIVRSFEAIASVSITATASLYEEFTIKGIQKGSNWFISISSIGDNSGVYFTINSSGQVLYTSPTYSGFVSGVIKFRALTTSV